MIWVFILAIGVAITFSTLGALSVWVKLLLVVVKAVVVLLGILSLGFLWKHIFHKTKAAQ